MHDVIDISYFIIGYCEKTLKKPITNSRLQRILYYIQGLSLMLLEESMFPNQMEAWRYGVVVPDSYYWFSSALSEPLTLDYYRYTVEHLDYLEDFNNDEKELIQQVTSQLIDIDIDILNKKVRNEYPWKVNHLEGYNMEIPECDLKKYFDSIIES